MVIEVTVPKFAEGATVIRLNRWLCQAGQKVEAGTGLAEATTDKIAIEIEAPGSGYVREILVAEGEEMRVGQVIALLASELAEEVE